MDEEKDTLQIKIDEAKKNLSEETLSAINAVDWRSVILSMREKRGYSFSQLEDLEIETELVLYGLVSPENYQKELEQKMNIPREESVQLLEELNEFIFNKIRNQLVKNTEKVKIPVTQGKYERKLEIKTETVNPEKQEEKENKILDQSGIDIVKELKKEETPINIPEEREEMLTKVENPELITPKQQEEEKEVKTTTSNPSFLTQKLNDSFKIAPVETKHSDTVVKHLPAGTGKIDPYRMPIE
ncbi:MAG: hypothetical protein ABH951_02345 [Patescibacteria group bacterium]